MNDVASTCRPVSAPPPAVLVAQLGPGWCWGSQGGRFLESVGGLVPEGSTRERVAASLRTLLDNAVRHATGSRLRVSLCVDAVTGDFRVQTENPADPGDWIRLRDRVAWLSARGAAVVHRELLARASEQGGVAGLGLARLADQARVRLAARMHEEMLQVVAASRTASFLPPAVIQGASQDDTALYVSHPGDGVVRGTTWEGYTRDLADCLLGGEQQVQESLETTRTGAGVRATGRWRRCAA